MELIFERSKKGHGMDLPLREKAPHLPELDEVELDRHYGQLEKQAFGVNHGFYPLGSCTMKYNPAVNETAASLKEFTHIHPLAPEDSAQGALAVMYHLQKLLSAITGMDEMTLQPAAGAQGEYTGLPTTCPGTTGNGRKSLFLTPLTVPIRPLPPWQGMRWSMCLPMSRAA